MRTVPSSLPVAGGHDLPSGIGHPSTNSCHVDDDGTLASIERAHVVEILNREHGNKTQAAKALGITRRSLYRLIDKYDIHPHEVESSVD